MRPLDGVRVLEFGMAVAGPTTGRYLAAYGADVVKVESPTRPDVLRMFPSSAVPAGTDPRVAFDTSAMFGSFNSNKRSVGVDLTTDEGRELVRRMYEVADVVVSNMSAPVLPDLGLGYDVARERNAGIIFCSLPGFGNTPSRYFDYRSYGPNLGPLCGLDDLTGWPDRAPSGIGSCSYPDYVAASHAALAILTALLDRDVSGEGQFIDISQFESTVSVIGPFVMEASGGVRRRTRAGNCVDDAAPHGVYPARGHDRWVAISVRDDTAWRGLCSLAGEQPFTSRGRHDVHDDEIAAWTRTMGAAELAHRLQSRGVPAGMVQDNADLLSDPHLEDRAFFTVAPHLRLGADLSVGLPMKLLGTPAEVRRAAPALGQDTDAVLAELVGLDEDERSRLHAAGVIASAPPHDLPLRRPYASWARHVIRREGWPS
jgi:crotonobetainyl-CoA:carnitine CoA-transferase CaiB-like acyl-CoA transferase